MREEEVISLLSHVREAQEKDWGGLRDRGGFRDEDPGIPSWAGFQLSCRISTAALRAEE